MKFPEISEIASGDDINQHIFSVDVTAIDQTRKRTRQDEVVVQKEPTPVHRQSNFNELPSTDPPPSYCNQTHARCDNVGHLENEELGQTQSSDSDSYQLSPSHSSSEDGDTLNEIDVEMEEDPADSFHFEEHSRKGIRKVVRCH